MLQRLRPAIVSTIHIMLIPFAFQFGNANAQTIQPLQPGQTNGIIIKYRPSAATPNARMAAPTTSTTAARTRVAQIVSQRFGVSASHVRYMRNGGQVVRLSRALPDAEVKRIADAIKASNTQIQYAVPDRIMQTMGSFSTWHNIPSDPLHYPDQWNLHKSAVGMNMPDAWNYVDSYGFGVVVAVVDSGVNNHQDLMANLLPGYDFVSDPHNARDGNGRDPLPYDPDNGFLTTECRALYPGEQNTRNRPVWHGTHVAGIIAAAGARRVGTTGWNWATGKIIGVAPAALIMPIRVMGRCGGTTSDIIDGVLWAIGETGVYGESGELAPPPHPARVVNLSLGGYNGGWGCSYEWQDLLSTTRYRNVVVVAAAGNSNADASLFDPASCEGVITVAASDHTGGRAFYSNYGYRIDVTAPGGMKPQGFRSPLDGGVMAYPKDLTSDILSTSVSPPTSLADIQTESTIFDGRKDLVGTSMAAPHVAGLAALLLGENPNLTPDQVKSIIRKSTKPLPGGCSGGCGTGLIDAGKAVRTAP